MPFFKIIVKSLIALSLVSVISVMPTLANTAKVASCENIPSCGVDGIVIGTEIIGGVLYYVVKNAAGVVHKVRAKQKGLPRTHVEPGRHRVGEEVTVVVDRREKCKQEALDYGRRTDGGEWVLIGEPEQIGIAGAPGTINPDGSINEPVIQYRCRLRKVR